MKRKRFSPGLERLEDRTVPSLDFGQAFSMGSDDTGGEWGAAITTDTDGNIYVLGDFNGTIDLDPGPGIYTLSEETGSEPDRDYFVAKYAATGELLWAQRMGGKLSGIGGDLAMDAGGVLSEQAPSKRKR